MHYETARPQIRSGDLLAWKHRVPAFQSFYDFKIWLVRVGQASEFTHVGKAWVSGGRVWVIESVIPIPRAVPLSNLLIDAYWLAMPPQYRWGPEVERFALSLVGNQEYQYSEWEAFKAQFGLNDLSDTAIQCAELVRTVDAHAGLTYPGRATPADVVHYCQKLTGSGLVALER